MGEVIVFDPKAKRLSPSSQKLQYESYVAYRQAEAAFRALYFGRPLDMEPLINRPGSEIVQRHWSTVQELAETLLRERSLTREQVLTLLLHASLDAAVGARTVIRDDVVGTGPRHQEGNVGAICARENSKTSTA